jgi:hypothetical protein
MASKAAAVMVMRIMPPNIGRGRGFLPARARRRARWRLFDSAGPIAYAGREKAVSARLCRSRTRSVFMSRRGGSLRRTVRSKIFG